MPAIDTPLLLDLLLGLVVLLFVAFGIRRGAAKEAMVSAGILLGAALAAAWSSRAGDAVAARFDLAAGDARFGAAVAALFGGAFVLGYGGGAALGRMRQGVLSHLVGGLLAALNAAVLLSYLLSFIERDLRPPRTFADGVVSTTLLRRFDLLLVGAAGLVLLLVVFGWLVTSIRRRREPHQPSPSAPGVPPRQRPVRLARDGDTGKYEPGPGSSPRAGRFGDSLEETAPVLDRPSPRSWGDGSRRSNGVTRSWSANASTNGHAADRDGADGWLRRASPVGDPGGDRDAGSAAATAWGLGHGAVPRGDAGNPGDPYGGGTGPSEASSGGHGDQVRCPACGSLIGSRDIFCAACGRTL